MKKFAILTVCAFSFLSCGLRKGGGILKPAPLSYSETVSEDDTMKIVQTLYYTVDSSRLDTIRKRPASKSERIVDKAQDEVVDLNDIFGELDPKTDWNYTELDPDGWEYLKKLGVYWDNESECWRRRSTETHENPAR